MLLPAPGPMKLVSRNGGSLVLSVDGYQFPEITDDRWDSNWLVVTGRVTGPRGSWTFRDPCLTTLELARLASWLAATDSGPPEHGTLEFLEPNLRFEHVGGPEPAIRLRLAHESAPPTLTGNGRLRGVLLEFPLCLNEPKVAATEARCLAERFPVRGIGGKPGPGSDQM